MVLSFYSMETLGPALQGAGSQLCGLLAGSSSASGL